MLQSFIIITSRPIGPPSANKDKHTTFKIPKFLSKNLSDPVGHTITKQNTSDTFFFFPHLIPRSKRW